MARRRATKNRLRFHLLSESKESQPASALIRAMGINITSNFTYAVTLWQIGLIGQMVTATYNG
jgi:hypothetical protein